MHQKRSENDCADGHVAAQPAVARAIDLAHSTYAERSGNLVGPEPCAGGKSHGCRTRVISGGHMERVPELYTVFRFNYRVREIFG
jgi:hypothetical protein